MIGLQHQPFEPGVGLNLWVTIPPLNLWQNSPGKFYGKNFLD